MAVKIPQEEAFIVINNTAWLIPSGTSMTDNGNH